MLLVVGGTPIVGAAQQFCADHLAAWECQQIRQVQRNGSAPTEVTNPVSFHDLRIKAAVMAVSAAAYNFMSGGLGQVIIPLQLWSADDDEITPPQ